MQVKPFMIQTGEMKSLNEYEGDYFVLFFYPKDNTPGWIIESKDFSSLRNEFKKLNTNILGVSRDDVKSHQNFIQKQKLKIDLIADEDEVLCTQFGVMSEKMMFKKIIRGIERSTFIIDKQGVEIKSWRKVKVPFHAQEVLDFMKNYTTSK